MLARLRKRNEWKFFAVLPKADAPLAILWWALLVLRGVLPAVLAIAMGRLVGVVQAGRAACPARSPLVGVVFVLLQVLGPMHTAAGANLGDRTAAWLYDRLTEACVRPPGMGHLEDPKLTSDLTVARDFDLGMTGPPLSTSMDFTASGLVAMVGGIASALILLGFAWWAPIVLGGAWLATHWLLRESAVWRDRNTDEVRGAQRDADYAFRLAVDPPASKELRMFGLVGWTIDRFVTRRTRLHELQYAATRLRERPVVWSMLIVTAANVIVFWALASAAAAGAPHAWRARRVRAVRRRHVADRVRRVELGLDGSAAPVAAVLRLEAAMAPAGALPAGSRPAAALPAREIRFHDVTFAYPGGATVLERLRSDDSRRHVARHRRAERRRQDDAREAAVPPVRPAVGHRSKWTASICASSTSRSWRSRLAAVFQDFIRFELPMRDNVAPAGAPDDVGSAGARVGRRGESRRSRHHPGARVRGRHGSVRRTVAARGAGARAVRRPDGRRRRAARRTDGAARCPRRGGDLRAPADGDAGTARRS